MSHFSSYPIREHRPQVVLSSVPELQCPVLQSKEPRGQPGEACSAPDFLEWLGAVFIGADLCVGHSVGCRWAPHGRGGSEGLFPCVHNRINEPDSFVSTYCCPQPSTVTARTCMCTITGFLLPELVSALLEHLW